MPTPRTVSPLALAIVRAAGSLPTAHASDANAPDGRFADPTSYDLAIAHTTDTQYLSSCANGAGVLRSVRQRCQAIYDGTSQRIVDNAQTRRLPTPPTPVA